VNISTGSDGDGQGVLIRAVEPVAGIDVMRARRGDRADRSLTDGPGKLAKAFGLDLTNNGDVAEVYDDGHPAPADPRIGPRVGITRAADWPRRYRVP
jgi:DNA-3-methyladenine glycosylase